MEPIHRCYQAKLAAPFAVLGIVTSGERLTGIDYLAPDTDTLAAQDPFTSEVCRQLRAYLATPSFHFDLPLAPGGTPFQRRVWDAIARIRCDATMTYGRIAANIGSGPRAVGNACGANPVPLVIPCHRVVGRDGLGGFMGTRDARPLAIKRWLLEHERA